MLQAFYRYAAIAQDNLFVLTLSFSVLGLIGLSWFLTYAAAQRKRQQDRCNQGMIAYLRMHEEYKKAGRR
jgi:hypothetical protein